KTLQDVVGIEEAGGFISVVGQRIGDQINDSYKRALAHAYPAELRPAPNASGVFTCSGRKPMPTRRAGILRRTGNRRRSPRGQGSESCLRPRRTRLMTRS